MPILVFQCPSSLYSPKAHYDLMRMSVSQAQLLHLQRLLLACQMAQVGSQLP